MGHVGLTSRSPGQIIQKPCFHSKGHVCDPILMKTWSECLSWQYLSRPSLNTGHVGSKNRSPGQILENSYILKL